MKHYVTLEVSGTIDGLERFATAAEARAYAWGFYDSSERHHGVAVATYARDDQDREHMARLAQDHLADEDRTSLVSRTGATAEDIQTIAGWST